MPHFHTDGCAADAAVQDLGAHAREHQLCQPLHVALRVLHAQPEEKRTVQGRAIGPAPTLHPEASLKGAETDLLSISG